MKYLYLQIFFCFCSWFYILLNTGCPFQIWSFLCLTPCPSTNKQNFKIWVTQEGRTLCCGPNKQHDKETGAFPMFLSIVLFFFSNLISLKIILTSTIKLLSHGAGLKITLHLLPCKLHSWPNFQLRFLLFESCSKKCVLFLLKLSWDIFLQEIKPIL